MTDSRPSARRNPLLARKHRSLPALASAAACIASSAPVARAEQIQVTLAGAHVESIHSAGVTVGKRDLRPGLSSGVVTDHDLASGLHAADDRDLATYFIRAQTVDPLWEVALGAWSPGPGAAADFFLFEVGGNDTVHVRPRFSNGTLGAPTTLSGWTPVGLSASTGPNMGQAIHGLGFRFEDLRRANGSPVQPSDVLSALVLDCATVDAAAFLIRHPGAGHGQDGNGSHTLEPAAPSAGSPVRVAFQGPWFSETDGTPNPFLDCRLTVTFRGPLGETFRVPGYFDADGARGDAGRVWAARFTPPRPGNWHVTTSFRRGAGVAVSLDPNAGSAAAPLDGRQFVFAVAPTDPATPGFHQYGTLVDQGRHHRKFLFGPWFLKIGVNSPENFLAYRGFDGTSKSLPDGLIHRYAFHRGDWEPGDPTIEGRGADDDGKGIIGSINYLADKGLNSMFMLLMNLGGDGGDVYPFIGPSNSHFDKVRYDASKLRQWDAVFEHAARRGVSLNLVLGETEQANETWLDNGTLGVERKLYYREMVARFGHHQAIKWTITEENDFSLATLDSFAEYIDEVDPYSHPTAVHNNPNDLGLFQSLAGNPRFQATSLQFSNLGEAGDQVELVRAWSAGAGQPWIADADEQGPASTGLSSTNAVQHRKEMLWDVLMSGGGVEFYLGYNPLPVGGDLSIEDFRTREEMWNYVSHARRFFEESQVPFWEMEPNDGLVTGTTGNHGGPEVLARLGDVYALYLPSMSWIPQLDLRGHTGQFTAEWFNPRTGFFVNGQVPLGAGDRWVSLGSAPSEQNEDWVVLVRRTTDFWARTSEMSVSAGGWQDMRFTPGTAHAGRPYAMFSTLSGTTPGTTVGGIHLPINIDGWTRFSLLDPGVFFQNTRGNVPASGFANMRLVIEPTRMAGLVGTTMHHVVLIGPPFNYISETIELRLVP